MAPEFLDRMFHRNTEPLTRGELRRKQEEEARRAYQARLHQGRRRFLIALPFIVGGSALALHRILNGEGDQDTLESLASKARKQEEGFRGADLFDDRDRHQYTQVFAKIFERYSPTSFTAETLMASTAFVTNHNEFVRLFEQKHEGARYQTTFNYYGFVNDGQVFIDLDTHFFKSSTFSRNPVYPRGWNPLKSLRMTLGHEWHHLIVEPRTEDPILLLSDLNNNHPNKRTSGFRMEGLDSNSSRVFVAFDEATVERLSIKLAQDLFGVNNYYSDYRRPLGGGIIHDITQIVFRLTSIMRAAQIDRDQLFPLYRQSKLGQFLSLLATREGITDQKEPLILRGKRIVQAIVDNDKALLEKYIENAKRRHNRRTQ